MALATRPTATLLGGANLATDYLIGSYDDDIITGGAAASVAAGDGVDTLEGGAGDDMYIVNDTLDSIIELANEGLDTVYATIDYTLLSEVENGATEIRTGGSASITLTGNTKDNKLDGTHNTAVDTLIGLTGNDTYYLDAGDLVTEQSNGGTDTIVSAFDVTLSTTTTTGLNIENVILTGSSDMDISGNTLSNKLTGNSGHNSIVGGSGNDTIDGGIDSVTDTLKGGVGDDVYIVRSSSDSVDETAGQGTADTVKAAYTGYTLATNVEKLILMGKIIAGSGNGSNNTLTGNSADNLLEDTAVGSAGNDTLDGGTGADTMKGGAGNDTYIVDNASDTVTELTGAGTDSIQSSVSFVFPDFIESITLAGTTSINATTSTSTVNTTITGNSAANTLTGGTGNDNIMGNAGNDSLNGGDGNDTLNGGTGVDTMNGGAGNDTYIIDSASEATITDASGTDTIQSSVTLSSLDSDIENITLLGTGSIDATGNGLTNIIIGNTGGNSLDGGTGNDTITGGAGIDTITGGTGADTFIFQGATAANADNISDFLVSETDVLAFDISSIGLKSVDYLAGAATKITAAAANALSAGAATNNIIVDTAANIAGMLDADSAWSGGAIAIASDTGNIYWDADANFSSGLVIVGSITDAQAALLVDGNLSIVA